MRATRSRTEKENAERAAAKQPVPPGGDRLTNSTGTPLAQRQPTAEQPASGEPPRPAAVNSSAGPGRSIPLKALAKQKVLRREPSVDVHVVEMGSGRALPEAVLRGLGIRKNVMEGFMPRHHLGRATELLFKVKHPDGHGWWEPRKGNCKGDDEYSNWTISVNTREDSALFLSTLRETAAELDKKADKIDEDSTLDRKDDRRDERVLQQRRVQWRLR